MQHLEAEILVASAKQIKVFCGPRRSREGSLWYLERLILFGSLSTVSKDAIGVGDPSRGAGGNKKGNGDDHPLASRGFQNGNWPDNWALEVRGGNVVVADQTVHRGTYESYPRDEPLLIRCGVEGARA